ncbi:MAG TPA: asparagine synthetase B, partial [Verrucomicrobiota bacterium]|nr:asparagine synthetase B [Verrucomicrobiota bacterium]
MLLLVVALCSLLGAEILVPMDRSQSDHLKAYGVAFEALKEQYVVKWLLNYRGGSFLLPESEGLAALCNIRGVRFELVSSANVAAIMAEIQEANMEAVVLEKEPKIAIYIPPNALPWDDAVTLALEYAEIEYDRFWDDEVLEGKLVDYDWLHLHHE